ncbi:MAG: LysR family transcriptional regulator [Austwickia sp.]|nr:LysR family transcriptional regulator [Austwickia sp.]MCO5308627.1 LysR family transcriptional regulator [Austwickia sp.]
MIDAAALRALTLIADTGSVAAAAEALGFTPSAVSQQVKRLEAQVGVALLARAGRGVVLTSAGESLCDAAPEVFAAMERAAQAAVARSAEPLGTLRVVAFSTAIRGLLVPCLPALGVRHPALTLEVREQDPAEAAAALATGAADLALLHDSAALPAWSGGSLRETAIGAGAAGPRGSARGSSGGSTVRRVVRTEQLSVDVGDVIVRADHPLAGRPAVTAADLRGDAWVTSPPGTACHDWFRRLFARSPQPEVRHRIDDFSTQIALVAAGGGIALVPRLARPALPAGLVALPVSPAPTRTVEAAWRRSSQDSPAIRVVLAALRAHVRATADSPAPCVTDAASR